LLRLSDRRTTPSRSGRRPPQRRTRVSEVSCASTDSRAGQRRGVPTQTHVSIRSRKGGVGAGLLTIVRTSEDQIGPCVCSPSDLCAVVSAQTGIRRPVSDDGEAGRRQVSTASGRSKGALKLAAARVRASERAWARKARPDRSPARGYRRRPHGRLHRKSLRRGNRPRGRRHLVEPSRHGE
jgi:hypothetical protein